MRSMESTWRSASLLVVLMVFPLTAADDALAQEGHTGTGLRVDARAGVALPSGELSEVSKAGPAVGVGATYWISETLGVRADGLLDLYRERDSFGPLEDEGPQMRAWHSSAGVALRFTTDEHEAVSTILGVGAGATFLESDSFLLPTASGPTEFEFRETYPAPYARLRVAYEILDRIDLAFDVRTDVILSEKSDTRVFEAATAGRVDPFAVAPTIPLTAGVSVGF